MNKAFIALLLFACFAGAQSAELATALAAYFGAVEAGNADAFAASMALDEGDDGFTRDAAQMFFDNFEQKDVEWSFIEEKFYGENYAHELFDLTGTVVEKESGNEVKVDEVYVAIFEKRGGKWLVWKLMPLNEFSYYAASYQSLISDGAGQQVAAIGETGSNNGGGGGEITEDDFGELLDALWSRLEEVDFGGLIHGFLGGEEDPHAGFDAAPRDSSEGEPVQLDFVDSIIGVFVLLAIIYAFISLFKKKG